MARCEIDREVRRLHGADRVRALLKDGAIHRVVERRNGEVAADDDAFVLGFVIAVGGPGIRQRHAGRREDVAGGGRQILEAARAEEPRSVEPAVTTLRLRRGRCRERGKLFGATRGTADDSQSGHDG